MDTTLSGTRNFGERRITLFCVSEKHRFCDATQPGSCSCDCHYRTTLSLVDLIGVAYAVSLAAPTIVKAADDDAEERRKFLELLRAFEPHADFAGLTAEVLFERLRPTIARATDARSYWSASMTESELKLKG